MLKVNNKDTRTTSFSTLYIQRINIVLFSVTCKKKLSSWIVQIMIFVKIFRKTIGKYIIFLMLKFFSQRFITTSTSSIEDRSLFKTNTLRWLIFARSKILHFKRIYFVESTLWKLFASIYFREWVLFKYFARINFSHSVVIRYMARTYFRESRKVTNIYGVEYTSFDNLIKVSHLRIIKAI